MADKIRVLIFVVILGTVTSFLLVGVSHSTRGRITQNREIKLKTKILDTFNIKYEKDTITGIFADNIKVMRIKDHIFYQSVNNELGFEITGSGLWGPISGVIVLEPDLERVKGLNIIHQEETPGLGGRIAEKEFLDLFKNKSIIPKLTILPATRKAAGSNEIDGITGATMTSKALEVIINDRLNEYLKVYKENK